MKIQDITDGTSNTILFGQVAANFKPWGHPINWRDPSIGLNKSPDGFGSDSRRGVMFGMADASVRFIKPDASPWVLRALSTPAGGEKTDEADLP